MVFTLQARWILLFSFIGTTFLIKSSLSRMIHSIWLKTKFEVLDSPAKILAFRSCHTWYTVAAKLSLQEKLTKLLPCQDTVAHRIHSSQPFVILGMSHLSQTSIHSKNKWLWSSLLRRQSEHSRNEKFQKHITWLIEPSSNTKWCEPHDHMVTQPTRQDTNSWKAK